MKASTLYRVAAVLLLLFAIGHTLGFRQSDPAWGVDALLAAMRSIHFDVQGFNRSYWDFFLAAGFSVGIFYFSRRYWPGNWVRFLRRFLRACAQFRGRSPFALLLIQL